jgi:hypothetical protein
VRVDLKPRLAAIVLPREGRFAWNGEVDRQGWNIKGFPE